MANEERKVLRLTFRTGDGKNKLVQITRAADSYNPEKLKAFADALVDSNQFYTPEGVSMFASAKKIDVVMTKIENQYAYDQV